jgi:hypothetical protein
VERLPSSPEFLQGAKGPMKTAMRHFSQTTNGLTRTVICVDRVGPDSVILFTDFDLQDNLLRQVRFEHLKGTLANALFTKFALDGRIEEQRVFVYDAEGGVIDMFGFDEDGNPLENQQLYSQVY